MVYFKTYFYSEHEIDFINLNLRENYDNIDKFILCECNVHHTGKHRDFIFPSVANRIDPEVSDKLLYIPLNLKSATRHEERNQNIIHNLNEPMMRGAWVKALEHHGALPKPDDVIVSVDADEIIYKDELSKVISSLDRNGTKSFVLNLNQFFYKINYFWEGKDFIAPVVCYFDFYKNFPAQWRYDGTQWPTKAGCHFSWVMSLDKMLEKAKVYSHPEYRDYATEENLKNAINFKQYFHPPWDKGINLKEINFDESESLYPRSIFYYKEIFDKYVFEGKE